MNTHIRNKHRTLHVFVAYMCVCMYVIIRTSVVCFRLGPHPVFVTKRGNGTYARVPVCSYSTAINGWVANTKPADTPQKKKKKKKKKKKTHTKTDSISCLARL